MKRKNNLSIVRRIVGLTGPQVSSQTDFPLQTIRNWESGSRQPLLDNLLKLSMLYSNVIHDYIKNHYSSIADPDKSLLNTNFTVDYLLHRQLTTIDIALLKFCYYKQDEEPFLTESYFKTYYVIRESVEYSDDLVFEIIDPTNFKIGFENSFMKGAPDSTSAIDFDITNKFWKK